MLSEIFKFFSNSQSIPIYVKKMGYLSEAIAMAERYKRCKEAWQGHIQNTHQAIKDSTTLCTKNNKVVILGAGSLIDIPLEYLQEQFQKIILVDIVFLKETKKLLQDDPKITLLQQDITFCLEDLYNNKLAKSSIKQLPECNDADLIISCNLASQLPVLPKKFILEHKLLHPNKANLFCAELIFNHFKMLEQYKTTKCVITDKERLFFDKDEKLIKSEDALFGNHLANENRHWLWNIAPIPEASTKFSIVNKVACMISI